MKPIDFSSRIPEPYRARIPRLSISRRAMNRLRKAARQEEFDDDDQLLNAVAESACSFLVSDYFTYNDWFPTLQYHPFVAVQFVSEEETTCVVLIADRSSMLILAESEVKLPSDYPERRIWQEARTEYHSLTQSP